MSGKIAFKKKVMPFLFPSFSSCTVLYAQMQGFFGYFKSFLVLIYSVSDQDLQVFFNAHPPSSRPFFQPPPPLPEVAILINTVNTI
jgi:hypothetical protein